MKSSTQKQRELLARLQTEAGLPRRPEDYEDLNSLKASQLIDDLLKEKKAAKRDYSEYFALEKQLQQLGYELTREDIVLDFTGGECTGLRQLTDRQYYGLLKSLRTKLSESEDPALQQMRMKIIALFRKMGYERNGKADMPKIYKWVKKYGKFHQPLNLHSKEELTELTTQVKMMYESHLKEIHRS